MFREKLPSPGEMELTHLWFIAATACSCHLSMKAGNEIWN
jgi:hypothetical protein